MKEKNLFWIAVLSVVFYKISNIIVKILKQQNELLRENEEENKDRGKKIALKAMLIVERVFAYFFGINVIYLLTCVFSHIYCNGRPILSYYLTQFSSFLLRHNK